MLSPVHVRADFFNMFEWLGNSRYQDENRDQFISRVDSLFDDNLLFFSLLFDLLVSN